MHPMTIEHVRTTLARIPYVEPPRFNLAYDKPRELVVVELETSGGVTGMGYLQPLEGCIGTIAACIREMMAPRIVGRQATEVEAIWADLWRAGYTAGRGGITVMAQSAIDIALWDAVGKAAGLPLHRVWGHYRSEVPAYGSGCWRGLGGDGMIEKARAYVADGFKAIKMQVGHMYDPRTQIENVRRMREALGPDIDIMVDANMAWNADEAVVMGRKLDANDIYWLEEPVRADDFAGYFRVADALATRVVGGENHFTRFDLRHFFEHPTVPILQPDPMRGGLTELRKIAAVADTWGMTIAPHCFDELMIQLMASIPNGNYLEHMGWLDDLWVEPVLPEGGMIRAPERPGHGLAFKPEILKDHTVTG